MDTQKEYTQDNFYAKKYSNDDWLNQRRKDAKELLDRIAELQLFDKKTKVLDVGSGSGDYCIEVMERYGSEVHGMDLNETGIKRSQEMGVRAVIADLDKHWPYEDGTFDVVSGAEIIEHVLNPDNFIREAYRVLKPEGTLIVQTPNLACWFNRIIFLAGYQPFFTEVSTKDKTIGLSFTRNLTPIREPVGHLRVFTLAALKELLALYNFEPNLIKGETVHYLPWYMDIIDKVMSKIPSLATDITVAAKKNERKKE
jgi:2-polyprenyl-3-methyl-5-hydroxy-6-metoxy-1,4-benzoquinol methylase